MSGKIVKKLLAVALSCSMLTGVAGCGTGGNAADGAANTEGADAAADAAQEGAQDKDTVNLRLAYWGGPAEKKNMESTCKAFEEAHPGITVELMHIPDDFKTKMQTMMASGTEPDLAYGNIMSYSWAKEGKCLNVFDLYEKYPDPEFKKEDLFDFAWYEWEKGKSFGGFIANGCQTLIYNPAMFEDAGVELPPVEAEDAWSWEEFVDVAQRLTFDTAGHNAQDPDFDPAKIKQYGVSMPYWWAGWLTMVRSNGGDIVTEDGSKFGLTAPEAVEAIQRMADLINVYHVTPAITTKMPNLSTSLQSRKVAMAMDGTWTMADLAEVPDFRFGVGVLPYMKDLAYIITSGTLCIMSSTPHEEESWELYKWINNPEHAIDLHRGLWLPQMKDWYEDPELIEKWASPSLPGRPEGFQSAVMRTPLLKNTSDPETTIKNFDQIEALVSPALEPVWLGKKTAEEAMKEVEPKVEKLIDGFYEKSVE